MKKIIAIALIVTVGSFSSLITGSAMAQVTSKLAGELSARGAVTLNGVNATSGATVFSGSLVKTGSNSMAAP